LLVVVLEGADRLGLRCPHRLPPQPDYQQVKHQPFLCYSSWKTKLDFNHGFW